MVYNPKLDWKNEPDKTTPITAADLIRIETGIADGDLTNQSSAASTRAGQIFEPIGLSDKTKTYVSDTIVASAVTLKNQALYSADRYGSMKEATLITDAAMTAGSAVLHSPTTTFTSAHVGMTIGVKGAGVVSTDYATVANDGVLASTIVSVSGGDATLGVTATNTVSGVRAVFGTPIDAALDAAAAAAATNGGGTVFIPAGKWITTTTTTGFATGTGVAGAGRARTVVYFVKCDATASNTETPWLTTGGANDADGYKHQVDIRDFTIDGQFFASTGGYTSFMKLILVSHTVDSSVRRMAILNCPATAIGYDESLRCVIEENTILNPGRFAGILNSLGSSSGSGIGIAVTPNSANATCVIRNNFIEGGWTAAGGTTRHGINLEGVYDNDTEPTYGKYIIDGNIIKNCYLGIRDTGAAGTIMSNNRISACQMGIFLGSKGSTGSRVPIDTLITGNVITDLVSGLKTDGGRPPCYGIEVQTDGTTDANSGNIVILGNIISGIPETAGSGIRLSGDGLALNHVMVGFNRIRNTGNRGIIVEDTINDLTIVHNTISNAGQDSSQNEAIMINTNVVWADGLIESNVLTDYQGTPTQNSHVVVGAGAVLTNVTIRDNTGDVSDGDPDYFQSTYAADNPVAYKNNTTTITNTATPAAVSLLSLPLAASTDYEFTAHIEFKVNATAGAKFGLTLPSGTDAHWVVVGAIPAYSLGATALATVAGDDSLTTLAVDLRGFIKIGTTAGTLTLRAAQATADASDLVVTTGSRLSTRRLIKQ